MKHYRQRLLLLAALVALAACKTSNAAPSLSPGAPPATPIPLSPIPSEPPTPSAPLTRGPARTPAPDINIPLENRLGAAWQRAEITWSPDPKSAGNLVVTYWAGWRTQTFLVDARTGETLDLTTENGAEVGMAAWSPDGKKLAAVAGSDMDVERSSVWLFAGGHKIPLLDGGCEDLAWSPDSALLLATCELYYWRGAPPPLDQSSSQAAPQQGGVWGGGQLWRMEAQAQAPSPRRLLDLVQLPLVAFGSGVRFDTARRAVWSPDGERVAFEVRSEDKAVALKMGVAVAQADGRAARLVTTSPVWLLGWLPDGKLMVRSNTFGGQITQYTDDLYALDLDTGAVENLTRIDPRCDPLQNLRCQGARRQILATPGYAALSPDGKRYYYRAAGRSDVIGNKGSVDWLVVGTYPPSDLVLEYSAAHEDPAGTRLLYPAWLADGRLAHVHTTGYNPQGNTAPNGVAAVRFIVNGQTIRQEEVAMWNVFAVGWSPDGSRTAVATDFGVLVYSLPASNP